MNNNVKILICLVLITALTGIANSSSGIVLPQVEYAGNPVFTGAMNYDSVTVRDLFLFKEPIDGNYYLFITGGNSTYWTIGVLNTMNPELTSWNDGGRILNIGEPGTWDSAGVGSPAVYDNTEVDGLYYMYYLGTNTTIGAVPTDYYQIGLATCSNIDGQYIKYSENPILKPTLSSFDSRMVYSNSLPIKVNATTWMILYSSYDYPPSTTPHWRIGQAYSDDLINWKKTGTAIPLHYYANEEEPEIISFNGRNYLFTQYVAGTMPQFRLEVYINALGDTTYTKWEWLGELSGGQPFDYVIGSPTVAVFNNDYITLMYDGDASNSHYGRKVGLSRLNADTPPPTPTPTPTPSPTITIPTTLPTTVITTIPTTIPTPTKTKTNCAKGICKPVKSKGVVAFIFQLFNIGE